jgi:selenocysteine lyase/cysteine desulfurase
MESNFGPLFYGIDRTVPVIGGERRYIDFDNAASTPALKSVVEKITEFLPWYANVHRGAGFTSRLSSWALEEARGRVARFVRADSDRQVVLFSRNTTESINHLASRFPFRRGAVVITTEMEHHSNLLPWRRVARVVHVGVGPDGRVDEAELRSAIAAHQADLELVAVTGASNVTGFINPVHRWARWAHDAGARIVVDAAQLAPHRPIDMNPDDPGERLDFVAFSAHKMYAPFGLGVLIGDRDALSQGDPYLVGGGSAELVGLEEARWARLPDREEAGTPAVIGAVALGVAIRCLEEIGWDRIIRHERALTAYALERLSSVPRIRIYGNADPAGTAERLGVIPFRLRGLHHGLVSEVLSCEWGIGTRSGAFCAHPYVKSLLRGETDRIRQVGSPVGNGGCSDSIGLVRASFGLYNNADEVDRLCEALLALGDGSARNGYQWDDQRRAFRCREMPERFERYFTM